MIAVATFRAVSLPTVLALRAFFVIGPLLAVWAVVLAVIGFTRPDFPGNLGRQRIVIAISLTLVVGVLASAVINAKFEHTEKPAKSAASGKKAAP